MGAHGIRPIDILYQKPSTSMSTSTTTGFVNGPGVLPPSPVASKSHVDVHVLVVVDGF